MDKSGSLMHFAGFAAIAVYLAFTSASIALFPGSFDPLNHWLSDLGNSSFNPRGAILYNVGMILTGLTLIPFFISMKQWETMELHNKRAFRISRVTGFLCAIALMLAGIFSEDYPIEHQVASIFFFVSTLIFFILVTATLMSHPRFLEIIVYYGFLAASLNLVLLCLALSTPYSTYLAEWLTVSAALGYVALLTYNTERLRKRAKNSMKASRT